jgi:putative ABC transport system substrate-binding protein
MLRSEKPLKSDPVSHRQRLSVSQCLLVAALAVVSLSSHAADPEHRIARVGFLSQLSPSAESRSFEAFSKRLREIGYIEGQNLFLEARFADGHIDRLPPLAAELVAHKMDVLFTAGTPGVMAAKNATSTIPIVFAGVGDPVGSGFAHSLGKPGGNLTGLSIGYSEGIAGKWLELLQQVVPRLSTVAVITNLGNPWERDNMKELSTIATERHLKVKIIEVREAEALDGGFDEARRQAQAVLVIGNAVTHTHRLQITALAAKHRLPAMYNVREFVDVGGLMAYGSDWAAQYGRAADYVDKILKGASPADLPIEQPTRVELLVNLKAARALGISFPKEVLLRADEIIQ